MEIKLCMMKILIYLPGTFSTLPLTQRQNATQELPTSRDTTLSALKWWGIFIWWSEEIKSLKDHTTYKSPTTWCIINIIHQGKILEHMYKDDEINSQSQKACHKPCLSGTRVAKALFWHRQAWTKRELQMGFQSGMTSASKIFWPAKCFQTWTLYTHP